MPTALEVHGDGECHICGKPKAKKGGWFCSYPHGLVPDEPIHPGSNMWSWKEPDDKSERSK